MTNASFMVEGHVYQGSAPSSFKDQHLPPSRTLNFKFSPSCLSVKGIGGFNHILLIPAINCTQLNHPRSLLEENVQKLTGAYMTYPFQVNFVAPSFHTIT